MLIAVAAFPLVWFVLGSENIGVYFAILAGLIAGVLIGFCTEYFTSDTYRPTKKLASTSETGSATIIIGGLSLGMISTALPIIIISACVLVAFLCSGGMEGATRGPLRRGGCRGRHALDLGHHSCDRRLWPGGR